MGEVRSIMAVFSVAVFVLMVHEQILDLNRNTSPEAYLVPVFTGFTAESVGEAWKYLSIVGLVVLKVHD